MNRTNTPFVNFSLRKIQKMFKKQYFIVDKNRNMKYNATKSCKNCIVKLLVTTKMTCYNWYQDMIITKGDLNPDYRPKDYSTQKCCRYFPGAAGRNPWCFQTVCVQMGNGSGASAD